MHIKSLIVALLALILVAGCASQKGMLSNRQDVHFTQPYLSTAEVEQIIAVKPGLITLDYKNQELNPKAIRKIKKSLPDSPVIFYCNPMEVFVEPAAYKTTPSLAALHDFLMGEGKDYLMHTADGDTVVYWREPMMVMLNMTSKCPKINGRTWLEFYADYLVDNMVKTGLWDGVYCDNMLVTADWIRSDFDANNDGQADNRDSLNVWLQQGVSDFLARLRKLCPSDFLIIGNFMTTVYPDKNGSMAEDFPNPHQGGWYGTMKEYAVQPQNGRFSVLLTHDPAKYDLVMASVLLNDGYFCWGQNESTLAPQIKLGQPKGLAHWDRSGVVWREYEGAFAFVNNAGGPVNLNEYKGNVAFPKKYLQDREIQSKAGVVLPRQ